MKIILFVIVIQSSLFWIHSLIFPSTVTNLLVDKYVINIFATHKRRLHFEKIILFFKVANIAFLSYWENPLKPKVNFAEHYYSLRLIVNFWKHCASTQWERQCWALSPHLTPLRQRSELSEKGYCLECVEYHVIILLYANSKISLSIHLTLMRLIHEIAVNI